MPMPRRRALMAALLAAAARPGQAALPVAPEVNTPNQPEISPVWRKVRASLFGQREVAARLDGLTLQLDAPARAVDGAVVPVALRASLDAPGRRVDKLYLVIDSNPSPVSAIFQFGPRSGRADVETRVRVDEYSHVRAIAELDDGRLAMVTRFVKAAGGCSAAPGVDEKAALAALGRMNLQVIGNPQPQRPVQAQLSISHPNHSGMALDQLTRLFTPAHFVRQVLVRYRGDTVLDADLDFSISENPSLRFWFVPAADGELTVEVSDTQARHFRASFPVPAGA